VKNAKTREMEGLYMECQNMNEEVAARMNEFLVWHDNNSGTVDVVKGNRC
jgi:hypothetical protein